MGLLQRTAETYDNMSHLAGIEIAEKTVLAPVGFITTKANIEITIDKDGNFISAKKSDEKISIPVTQSSAGRTSSLSPHALCDNLGYLSPYIEKKNSLYIEQLENWCASEYCDEKAMAVLKYIKGKTIIKDLFDFKLILPDGNGNPNIVKKVIDSKVIWRVLGLSEPDEVWKDTRLMKRYSEYYQSLISDNKKGICYISGKNAVLAEQHIKGVVPINGNAKIISTDNDNYFTFLGRFLSADEAVQISYEMSQKSHNALKWLIENDGVIEGNRAFICWNPKGKEVPKLFSTFFSSDTEEKAEPTNYKRILKKIIDGYKLNFEQSDRIIIASFDAATNGRLSITYYNEFGGDDFFERMRIWDESICFAFSNEHISTPYLKDIVRVAFGTQRGDGENAILEVDTKLMVQQLQRLLVYRIEGLPFPTDIMRASVEKAQRLIALSNTNKRKVLFTTCAVIKKYRFDRFKEEWEMSLERDRKDRSYQYGRLLAVFEQVELSRYGNDKARDTNAIRMQSVFVKRPGYAASIIIERLKSGYYPKLSYDTKVNYEKIIGEIMEIISECEKNDYNKPLTETYLLGYYLQKNDFYKKKNNENTNSEDTENE